MRGKPINSKRGKKKSKFSFFCHLFKVLFLAIQGLRSTMFNFLRYILLILFLKSLIINYSFNKI